MLTFNQIKALLPRIKLLNAKYTMVTNPRVGFDKKSGLPFFIAQTYSTKVYDPKLKTMVPNPRVNERYLTEIHTLDKKGHIELSCSCPDFLFRHEVALFDKDAAQVEYSNGDYPKITNPLLKPTCCKHCLSFYTLLHSKGFVK